MIPELKPNFTGLGRKAWLKAMAELVDPMGDVIELGDGYIAYFIDRGPQLLVSFQSLRAVYRQNPQHVPLMLRHAQSRDDSVLLILSLNDGWFRSERIFGYFDRLVDDGFFEDFRSVLFYGADKGGYAAAAYSLVAPDAKVLALGPVATLEPRITGWDKRYIEDRRIDFTSRYGYAPEMVETAQSAHVVFDPHLSEDFMHAQLYAEKNVTLLRSPNMGPDIESSLNHAGILHELIEAAAAGTLTEQAFYAALRARHRSDAYLGDLITRFKQGGQLRRAKQVCDFALSSGQRAPFTHISEDLSRALRAKERG